MKRLLLTALILLAIMPLFMPNHAQALDRPELIAPTGSASGDSILFEWWHGDDVDEFRLEVWQDDSLVYKEYIDEDDCDDDESSEANYGIEIDIGPGSNEMNLSYGYLYTWKIRAYTEFDHSSWSYGEEFWYEYHLAGPAIAISPVSGDSGTRVTIRGYGWNDGEDVELYIERELVDTLNNVDTDWNTSERIRGSGTQSIRAWGEDSGWSNYCWFLIAGPDVEINAPSPVKVGETIEVEGDNWPENESISIYIGTHYADTVSSRSGHWQTNVLVPELPAGDCPVEAYSRTASAMEYIEIEPDLMLSPESTGPGEPVSVSGTGYARTTTIRISLDNSTFYGRTDNYGSFIKEIKAPADSGTYIVNARDNHGNEASVELSIGGIINVSPAYLYIGHKFVVSGISFTPGREVDILFDDEDIGQDDVDRFGNFSVELTMDPGHYAGRHIITADDGKVSASVNVEIDSEAPNIPMPIQPTNSKVLHGTRVTFDWVSVYDESGVTYEVEAWYAANDDDVVSKATVTADNADIELPGEGAYYWHVRAIDGAGNTSNWSAAHRFEVESFNMVIIIVAGAIVIIIVIGLIFWTKGFRSIQIKRGKK